MTKFCGSCGAKLVEYKHSLSKGLARGLYKIAIAGGGPVNLNDLKMTLPQQTNFQKLRYWGLVQKSDPSNLKGGEWVLTHKGHDFINGKISIQKFVWTYRGKTVRFDGVEISFEHITGGYKYRGEYAAEAIVHGGRR